MYKMNEMIESRLAAYKKMEDYSVQSNLSGEGFDRKASEWLGEEGGAVKFSRIFKDLVLSLLLFVCVFFIFSFILVLLQSDGSFIGLDTWSGLIKFSSILLTLSILFVFWDSRRNIKNHKEEGETRKKARIEAKKLKAEMDELFKEYEEKLLNLDISQYKGKDAMFYENLSEQEALVLKEYKIRQEQRPNSELMNYLGNKEEQLMFND